MNQSDIKTIGEIRVRTEFNPSKDDLVSEIKQKAAELINLIDSVGHLDRRLDALAKTSCEECAMWAVKLATS